MVLHIVQIVTELCPVAKVGGLGDVIYGLAKELARQKHEVEIILPKYDTLHYDELENLQVEQREIWSYDGPNRYNNTVWSAKLHGLKLLLIEAHHPLFYFNRGMIYGCHDDIDRFAYFSRAAMEFLYKSGRHPDVIHAHDWPTALVPVLYKEMYQALGMRVGGTVLTIHNMEHQGKCQPFNLTKIGLRGENEKMQDPILPGHLNLLKGGIVYADKVTTVSPNYEKEIQTPEGGFGLHTTLIENRRKLKGILNGIDEDFWNPEKDKHLVKKYATHGIAQSKLPQVLEAKKENKKFLRQHFRLKESNAPLVACVTRLVPQKSPELIKYALQRTLEKGAQFVLLGNTPIPAVQKEFGALQADLKNNPNGAVFLDKDEALAHQIYAAADLLVIPSLFEPCGLTQLIALRYGAVPIARLTGGLADTVFDVDTSTKPQDQRNGFTFEFPDRKGIDWALDRALSYSSDAQKWPSIVYNGLRQDFSWKHVIPEYIALYQELGKGKIEKVKIA